MFHSLGRAAPFSRHVAGGGGGGIPGLGPPGYHMPCSPELRGSGTRYDVGQPPCNRES